MINKLKEEKGSITVYVLVAMLFLLAIVTGRYVYANRQLKTQVDALGKLQNVYSQPIESGGDSGNTSGSTTDGGLAPGVTIETIDSDDVEIPIYNNEAFEYFKSGNKEAYYIYQEGKKYVGGTNRKYILMFDITSTGDGNSLWNDSFLQNLDFNNHIIYTSDGNYYYYGYNRWGSI